MTAVELTAGNEIEGGDEEADPACDEDGVVEGVMEVRSVEDGCEDVDGQRLAESDHAGRGMERYRPREGKSESDGDERDEVAGERAVSADVDERLAGRNAALDLYDGSGGAAEGGGWQHPGERGAYAVGAACEIVAKFVGEQDGEQSDRERPPQPEAIGMLEEPGPWPEIVVGGERGVAEEEVMHEACADGCGGERAEGE